MKIEQGMKQAKASLLLEGFEVKPEHDILVRSRLTGEISEEEFQQQALELAQRGKNI